MSLTCKPFNFITTALLYILFANCAGENTRRTEPVVIDSAGVTIVENTSPAWAPEETWTIAQAPRIQIGQESGPRELQLFDVRGAIRLETGAIVVADRGSNELRFFDEDGSFVRAVGGPGEGPGEFRSLDFIARLSSDSVLTYDGSLVRLQVFDAAGRFARALKTSSQWVDAHGPLEPVGALDDGTLVVLLHNRGALRGEGLQRGTIIVATIDTRNGIADSIGELRGPEQNIVRTTSGFRMEGHTFGAYSQVAIGRNVIATASTEQFAINIMDRAGRPTMSVRKSALEVDVEPNDVEAYIDDQLRRWPPGMSPLSIASFRERIRTGQTAQTFPLFRGIFLDASGNLWVETFPPPGSGNGPLFVFGGEGRWLGEITLPVGLDRGTHPSTAPQLELGDDYILGVWRDELCLETVRLYDLYKRSQ